jgi:6-phosphofructokinase 2
LSSILTLSLNPTIDVSSEAEVVRPTHKTRTENERFEAGGGGINVARVVRELGGETEAVYLAGGASGALLDELLGDLGLKRQSIRIAGHTRIALMVYERSTGLEYRFIPSGPSIASAEIEAARDAVSAADFGYLVASGSIPAGCARDVLVRFGQLAAAKGARFILDSSGPGLAETIGKVPVHLVKPSQNEFQEFVGRKLGSTAMIAAAALELIAAGSVEIIAVTLGRDGAVVASRDGAIRITPPKVEVRSAVGAGDSFLAAMTLALSEGRSVTDAALLGTAAGAAAVLSTGTTLCSRADILNLYETLRRNPAAVETVVPAD